MPDRELINYTVVIMKLAKMDSTSGTTQKSYLCDPTPLSYDYQTVADKQLNIQNTVRYPK